MPKQPSMLNRVIEGSATRLAERWQIPAEHHQAFVQSVFTTIRGEVSRLAGGETFRMRAYAPNVADREARRARILAARKAGEAPAVVAKREGVSARWVRQVWASEP